MNNDCLENGAKKTICVKWMSEFSDWRLETTEYGRITGKLAELNVRDTAKS